MICKCFNVKSFLFAFFLHFDQGLNVAGAKPKSPREFSSPGSILTSVTETEESQFNARFL